MSDLAVAAGERLLAETGVDPGRGRRGHVLRLDLEGLGGVAGGAAHRAPARLPERVRGRVRQRLARDADRAAASRATCCAAEPELRTILMVAACRESYLLDYGERAVAVHVQLRRRRGGGAAGRRRGRNEVLGAHTITDGSFSLHVKVGAGRVGRPGRVRGSSTSIDPEGMKRGLDAVSLDELRRGGRGRARAVGRVARRRGVRCARCT